MSKEICECEIGVGEEVPKLFCPVCNKQMIVLSYEDHEMGCPDENCDYYKDEEELS